MLAHLLKHIVLIPLLSQRLDCNVDFNQLGFARRQICRYGRCINYTCISHKMIKCVVLLRFSKSCKRSVSAGFVKKIRGFGFGSWWRHYKVMYTPAIKHSTCPVVGGKRGDEHTSQASVPRRYRHNVPCVRQQCRGDNYLGHLKGLDIPPVGRDRRQSRLSTWHCLIYSFLHLDHSTTSSVCWHPVLSTVSSLTQAMQRI